MPPTDPLIYRFYELVMVNGPAWKALIEEEYRRRHHVGDRFRYGDGAPAEPKGDRVKITMSGKFLPYKYYGASGNVPEYGFKEGLKMLREWRSEKWPSSATSGRKLLHAKRQD